MSFLNADRASAREKFNFYNTLAVLLKAVEGHKTTIDLRNESYITGIVNHADGYMNVEMKDCIFTDSRGDSFKFEMFFVQARNIRFVHIPPHVAQRLNLKFVCFYPECIVISDWC
ncbi:U7 snRNA-associated Sm-like protein LSm10 [Leptopilina heterotoma]|uniref:U7 snRNA-associated Sm-like protein LSm10 n=1 Tax=Leptopilina heterotoma TaxID=63436 RepID=UPI001CA7EAAB|nr:U7 snRNA-associated Sm-like protein LSm10 [Leptopilina heterotoma]